MDNTTALDRIVDYLLTDHKRLSELVVNAPSQDLQDAFKGVCVALEEEREQHAAAVAQGEGWKREYDELGQVVAAQISEIEQCRTSESELKRRVQLLESANDDLKTARTANQDAAARVATLEAKLRTVTEERDQARANEAMDDTMRADVTRLVGQAVEFFDENPDRALQSLNRAYLTLKGQPIG